MVETWLTSAERAESLSRTFVQCEASHAHRTHELQIWYAQDEIDFIVRNPRHGRIEDDER